MAMDPFKVKVKSEEETIAKIKALMKEKGGKFDPIKRTFAGKGVEGNYVIVGNEAIITITDYIWGTGDYVESTIRKFLEG